MNIDVYDNNALKRYNDIINIMSFDNFLENIKNKNYNITIENVEYSIPISQMVDFTNISNEDFDKICNDSSIKEINGIKKEHFIYAVTRYFTTSGVFNNYIVPENIELRINEIRTFRKIDIEAINKINEIDDFNFEKTKVNEELKNFIFRDLTYINSKNGIIYKTYNFLEKRIELLKSSSFLKAMILGNTSSFEDSIYETYKINGIVHLFAISGMHVAIITAIIVILLQKIVMLNLPIIGEYINSTDREDLVTEIEICDNHAINILGMIR